MDDQRYLGQCFCGAVELIVSGEPAAVGYCHCQSCRTWSAAPVNAFTLWKPDQVSVRKGQESVASFNKTPKSKRQFCKVCGGHLMAEHPEWDLIDVYAPLLKDATFEPTLHVNYGERTLEIRDGLPKFRDVPQEMGGSGEQIRESDS